MAESIPTDPNELAQEVETLRVQLAEAEAKLAEAQDVIRAIRTGDVDAVIVSGPDGEQVFTLVEEALRRRSDLMRLAFDAIIVWRLDGGIESWNRGAEQLYGYSESEALGLVTHELLRTAHSVPWPEIEAGLRRSGNWEGELHHFTKEGREVVVSARHQLVVGGDGVERVLEMNRDITERKRAEQESVAAKELAEKTLAQFRANIDNMSEGMYVIDASGKRLLTNPAYFRIHGFDPVPSEEFAVSISALLERYDLNGRLLSPEEWPVSRALRGETVVHTQQRVRRSDNGHEVILSVNAVPVRNAAGKVMQAVVTISDITESKKSEEALRQSEERWSTTLRSIGDAVISTCAQGKVVFMNEVAEKLTGWPLSEAQGRDLEEVFNIVNEMTRVKPENPVAQVIRMKQVVGLSNHTALITRSGIELPIEDSAAPIRDKDGRVTGVVLVFHDISEKRRAEKAVRDSERLAMTGRMAATLAHEIHNPLDTVGSLLYLIDHNPDVPEAVRQHVAIASEELTRVTQMTRHMLSFQREAKSPVPIKIGDVLDSVIVLYERKIASAGIKVEKQVDFEGEFNGLPGEMRQVFANLLGNAIEAIGKDGKIRLHAYASTDWHQGRRGLRVTVADNGPGIPAEICNKIFDPFFTTKGEGGTGLGLWIVSGIVEHNDGVLWLRTVTRAGRSGTCFSVFFPFPA